MNLLGETKKRWKVIVAALIVLILAGVIYVYLNQRSAAQNETLVPVGNNGNIEVFSLAASIFLVDSQNHFIIVKHPAQDQEIKVILNGNSEIVKLEFPFDPKNPPKSGTFVPTVKKITLNDLKPGNQALIESRDNIYQKTEFDSVKRIQVLP